MSAAATPDVSLYSFDVNVQAFIISTTNNIYVCGGWGLLSRLFHHFMALEKSCSGSVAKLNRH